MPEKIIFTEARVKSLHPPETGRKYIYDAKTAGLAVCVTANGSKTWYVYRWAAGRPVRIRLGKYPDLSVETARKAASEAVGQLASGRDLTAERNAKRQEPTLADLWEHWLLYATAHKRPRSVEEDQRNYRLHLATLAGRRLSTIKKAEVQALHARIGREKGIYAANRVLALLRAMLNKAEDIGHRGGNPAAGVKMFKEEARDRFLHPQELEAFFHALAAETPLFRDFFAIRS